MQTRTKSVTTYNNQSDTNNESNTTNSNKIAIKANRQRHALQHLEPRHCDVIVLIRDAYGKYAWEASGIFNV